MRLINNYKPDYEEELNKIPNRAIFEGFIGSFLQDAKKIELKNNCLSAKDFIGKLSNNFIYILEGDVTLVKNGIDLVSYEKGDLINWFYEFDEGCYIKNSRKKSSHLAFLNKIEIEEFLKKMKFYDMYKQLSNFVRDKVFYINNKQPLQLDTISGKVNLGYKYIKQNDLIIKSGENIRLVYYLIKGKASIMKDGKKISSIEEGCFFGHYSLLLDIEPIADVVADTNIELITIKDFEFNNLIGVNRFITKKVIVELLNQIKLSNSFLSNDKLKGGTEVFIRQ